MNHPGGYQPRELYTMTHMVKQRIRGKTISIFWHVTWFKNSSRVARLILLACIWNGGSVTKQATTTCRTHKKRRITKEKHPSKNWQRRAMKIKKGAFGGTRQSFPEKTPCTIHKWIHITHTTCAVNEPSLQNISNCPTFDRKWIQLHFENAPIWSSRQ